MSNAYSICVTAWLLFILLPVLISGKTAQVEEGQFTATVSPAAVAFFDAHLRGLFSKESWIKSKFSDTLDAGDHFEFK